MFDNGLNWTGEYFNRGLAYWPQGVNSPAIPQSMPRTHNPVAALASAHPPFAGTPRPLREPLWLSAWRGLFRPHGAPSLMGGLMSAINFSMDKNAYALGEKPVYRITGAPPGAVIAWTSFHNGQPTGEYQADYGARAGADGSWQDTAVQSWSAADAGEWEKDAVVISGEAPNWNIEVGRWFFTVGAPASATPATTDGGGLPGGYINLPIIGSVPLLGALAVGGVAVYAFTRR